MSEETINKEKKIASPKSTEENLQNSKKPTTFEEEKDYTYFTENQCVSKLKELIIKEPIEEINKSVNALKSVFYKIYRSEANVKLQEYKKLQGTNIGFEYNNPLEEEFRKLLHQYKVKRANYNKKLEVEKQKNLEEKYQLIEAIKSLINSEELTQKTFNEFKNLQKKWLEIGMVPQTHVNILWGTYNHHVEKFYDYLKINRDLRDIDYKKNLEIKEELINKTEKLIDFPKVVESFEQLQNYHQQWKETGPVHPKHRIQLWDRFKEITRKINKRHQDYFTNLKQQQKDNLKEKTLLCEKIEAIVDKHTQFEKMKNWNMMLKKILQYQEKWKTIGFTPKKDNNKVYKRYRNACNAFFEKKRQFKNKLDKELKQNLAEKKILIEKVKTLINGKDLENKKAEVIKIQQDWKKIGPVAYKKSDEIWHEFMDLCNNFFDRQRNNSAPISIEEQSKNLKLKNELINTVKQFKFEENTTNKESIKIINDFQKEFDQIGLVPYANKDEINSAFLSQINQLFDQANIDNKTKNLLRFKEKIRSFKQQNAENKIAKEKYYLINQLSKLQNDINLWTNNISFFNSNSKNGDTIIKQYQKRIDTNQEKLHILKEKLNIINNML